MYLTVLNAHDLVDQTLVGELCAQWRNRIHISINDDELIDLVRYHVEERGCFGSGGTRHFSNHRLLASHAYEQFSQLLLN